MTPADTLSIDRIRQALADTWEKATSSTPEEWSNQNPARGQCVVSSLIIQDYFGGDLLRYIVHYNDNDETHYVNMLPSGELLDSTRSQYPEDQIFEVKNPDLGAFNSFRERALAGGDTRARYDRLRTLIDAELNVT